MSDIKYEHEKPQKKQHHESHEGLKNIVCVGKESYLNELVLNAKSMQRMQDFIRNLDVATV
jgi:hypothetical protein